jgi:hypothetical protein
MSPTATISSENDNTNIRNMLQQTPSTRVQQVLQQLQLRLAEIHAANKQVHTSSATKSDSENGDKVAVMIYSFSEVN